MQTPLHTPRCAHTRVSKHPAVNMMIDAVARFLRRLGKAVSGRDLLTWNQAVRLLRRVPLTIGLFVAIVAVGVVTGTVAHNAYPGIMQRFGWNLPALREGRFYDLWVGLLFGSGPGVRWSMILVLLLGVGSLEFVCGTGLAAIAFLILGPIASVVTVLLLWPLDTLGAAWVRPFLYPPDMGSSSAALVCWGAVIGARAKGGWRAFFIAGTALPLAALVFLLPQTYAIDHLVAFGVGLAGGFKLPCKLLRTSRATARQG